MAFGVGELVVGVVGRLRRGVLSGVFGLEFVDLVDGLAQFAADQDELALVGGEGVGSVGLGVEEGVEADLECAEGGEQSVGCGLLGDFLPVLFEQAEVVVDGGGGDVEDLSDAAGGGAGLAELVGVEDASASLGGDGGGTHVLY